MTEDQVIELIRAEVVRAGTMTALAQRWGVSASYIGDLLNGRRPPGPTVLAHLHLRRIKTVDYQPFKGDEHAT